VTAGVTGVGAMVAVSVARLFLYAPVVSVGTTSLLVSRSFFVLQAAKTVAIEKIIKIFLINIYFLIF
jgi:hypothetical protein